MGISAVASPAEPALRLHLEDGDRDGLSGRALEPTAVDTHILFIRLSGTKEAAPASGVTGSRSAGVQRPAVHQRGGTRFLPEGALGREVITVVRLRCQSLENHSAAVPKTTL